MTDDDGRRRRFEHRRGEVLQAATEAVLAHGLSGLSLRRLSAHVGVSHATLLHHFGSREQLVAEVVESILGAALAAPQIPDGHPDPLAALWERARSARGRALSTAFLEIAVAAAHADGALREAVVRSVGERVDLLAAGFTQAGCPQEEAEPLATLVLASLRGLMVDLISTGDERRAERAFDVLRDVVETRLERGATARHRAFTEEA
ncbi:TetR/AcrR family transcriptional regulator [Microbacterium sp. JZ37]|uniref:TetR/AcrR family transcriptional regulator n=1 Tax=Microbacterium sp. JZ37 TaxID=2654193 RepID=UPI002B46B227|nr:TetR/AcrR family transcriptional regulator [Microbacterium sp. JZ37]WRH18699.1 TetR family transcriptional regulator [Microbacterium sp. JZ37]